MKRKSWFNSVWPVPGVWALMSVLVLIGGLVYVFWSGVPQALSAVHSRCDYCHRLHGSPGADLGDPGAMEILCSSCHGTTGTAAHAAAHINHHSKGNGEFRITCATCHDPHDNMPNRQGGNNLAMVGRDLLGDGRAAIGAPGGGVHYVTFEARGTDAGMNSRHSFADGDEDGDGVYDGICEVCHTQTKFHRNNSGGDHSHYRGRTCTACHPHDRGFRLKEHCARCHTIH